MKKINQLAFKLEILLTLIEKIKKKNGKTVLKHIFQLKLNAF